jgi:Flp pilus assembly protein TadD
VQEYPFWSDEKGYRHYFGARIDYHRIRFMETMTRSLARAYAARGRTDQALAALTRAADQDLSDDAVALARARVWVDVASQTTDGAYLSRALATLAPLAAAPRTDSEVLTLYGRALLLDGSLAAAERTLDRATSLFPVAPGAFGLLAEAAARRGHHAAAVVARAKHDR